MKILYYNHSFRSKIGGGTHAREVFQSLKDFSGVEVNSFPPSISKEGAHDSSPKQGKLRWIPNNIAQWLRFWLKPIKGEINDLRRELTQPYDVIFFRPNMVIRLVPVIKQMFPDIYLCLEINALIHSEGIKKGLFHSFWLRREVALINYADSMMVVSDYLKKQLIGLGIPAEKVLVNHNGVNLNLFDESARQQRKIVREKLGLPVDAFVLGYIGGMELFRKLPLMLYQILRLMREDDRIYFVMAGDGMDRVKIDKLLTAAHRVIRSRIHFDGNISYEKVPALMSSLDCAIFPYSNPYGSPQKLFEYMAMKIPVIGPDVPVVREIFKNDEHLLLANQSGSDFISLVKRVKEHADMASLIAQNGFKLIVEQYSWKHNATRLLEFICSRMGGNQKSG